MGELNWALIRAAEAGPGCARTWLVLFLGVESLELRQTDRLSDGQTGTRVTPAMAGKPVSGRALGKAKEPSLLELLRESDNDKEVGVQEHQEHDGAAVSEATVTPSGGNKEFPAAAAYLHEELETMIRDGETARRLQL